MFCSDVNTNFSSLVLFRARSFSLQPVGVFIVFRDQFYNCGGVRRILMEFDVDLKALVKREKSNREGCALSLLA